MEEDLGKPLLEGDDQEKMNVGNPRSISAGSGCDAVPLTNMAASNTDPRSVSTGSGCDPVPLTNMAPSSPNPRSVSSDPVVLADMAPSSPRNESAGSDPVALVDLAGTGSGPNVSWFSDRHLLARAKPGEVQFADLEGQFVSQTTRSKSDDHIRAQKRKSKRKSKAGGN